MNHESKTDWQRVDALNDKEIEEAVATDPDAAPIADDDSFQSARPASENEVLQDYVASQR